MISPPLPKRQKRSVRIAGHGTSLSLEPLFWKILEQLAKERNLSLAALISTVDQSRTGNLASTLRVFAVEALNEKYHFLKSP